MIIKKLRGGLIVSCQALKNEPLYGSDMMARMAIAAKMGGAVGIRANTARDIRAIKRAVDLPVIGLIKKHYNGFEPYITPTMIEVDGIIAAGADIVALDLTSSVKPGNLTNRDFVHKIRKKYKTLIMADISTYEEGLEAEALGVDLVSTTLSGYTANSPQQEGPDFDLVERLSGVLKIPLIAEGRIQTPEEAKRAMDLGAYSVVVGGAITRPQLITERFSKALRYVKCKHVDYFDLVQGFQDLGLGGGDSVLVHSSLSSFGHVEGGAETVIQALLNTVGDKGAVVVPTLTGQRSDGKEHPPKIDVRQSPCWTGKIPETFMKLPNALRSLHPTHSVAVIGEKGKLLIDEHEKGNSPCDKYSPYYKNAQLGGYIMLIGVDQESNTTIHCCEELATVPYHLHREATKGVVTDASGQKIVVTNRLHDWEKKPTDFNKLEDIYLSEGVMTIGKIGDATIRLLNAKKMLEVTVELLKKDPYFLLED